MSIKSFPEEQPTEEQTFRLTKTVSNEIKLTEKCPLVKFTSEDFAKKEPESDQSPEKENSSTEDMHLDCLLAELTSYNSQLTNDVAQSSLQLQVCFQI